MAEKRLIDANLVLGRLKTNIILGATEQAFLRNYVNCCPTVDAVEVVRCKDCKYYCQDEIYGEMCRHPELDFEIECYDHWINTKPDDFCSYGERKDGDGNG